MVDAADKSILSSLTHKEIPYTKLNLTWKEKNTFTRKVGESRGTDITTSPPERFFITVAQVKL